MITIKNLSKHYGKKQVLIDINLTLAPDHVYGIVGKNGSGKTTLFRCMAGIENYTGVIESEYQNLKNHIGLLETNPIFMSRITGWEYLKLLCIARNIDADDFERQNIFDLPLGQYADTYSTGMKKKLALMAVLMQKNEIFILDEPFNGVDIQSNILIAELISELRKRNKIIIISSHIFSILGDTCDNIFLLNEGKVQKSVLQEDYAALEREMKNDIIRNNIDRLDF